MKERIEELSEEIIRIPAISLAGGLVQTYLNALVNEALERAAKECDGISENHWPGLDAGASGKCAESIRKLKV